MFTPGFRLFFGFALAGVVGLFVYGVASGDGGGTDYLGVIDAEAWIGAVSLGWKGGIGDHVGYVILALFATVSAFLAIVLVAYRDADPESVAELAGGELPPAQAQTTPNYWPAVGAFGAGVVAIGLVTHAAIFVIGLIILAATAFEWMMAAWADRATGDPATNRELRTQVMGGVEMPILGALGIAILVLAVSRVFLAVSAAWAVWIAVGLAGLIFLGAVTFAAIDRPNKNVVAGVVVLGAIIVIAGGIITASIGERDFHHPGEDGDDGEHGEQVDHVEEGALG